MKLIKLLLVCVLMVSFQGANSQDDNPIAQLKFLVGNWQGPGITYREDGSTEEYFDTEYVRFDLDQRLLLINAAGAKGGEPFYQLHTVIHFDSELGKYIYTPYSGKRKPSSFSCDLNAERFICINSDGDYRLTFQRLEDGSWNEFGERLTQGKWEKRFETILTASTKESQKNSRPVLLN